MDKSQQLVEQAHDLYKYLKQHAPIERLPLIKKARLRWLRRLSRHASQFTP